MDFSSNIFPLKNHLLSGLILLSQFFALGQDTLEISELEYYFDVDPGVGSAISISVSPDSLISSIESLGSSGLSVGFHVLGFRAKNLARADSVTFNGGASYVRSDDYMHPALKSSGQWGMTETRLVYIDPSETGGIVNVDAVEYFFDVDPGVGSATLIDGFTASTLVSLDELLISNSLEFGFHSLGMRARAEGGSWGLTETRLIFVDQSESGAAVLVDSVEYFFDIDPGVGSATIIDGFTASTLINLDELLISNSLELGFHSLGMRAKAVGGSWGLTEARLVFIDPSSSGGIVNVDQIEYFFDTDPGVGSATSINSFAPNDILSLDELLTSSGLAAGFHVLGMRARAEGGSWGPAETRLVYIDNADNTDASIIEMEYFVNDDPGIGMATSIPVSIPGSDVSESVSIDLSGLPSETHNIYVRALNDRGEWGLIETDSFRIVNIAEPIITSVSGDTTNATPINIQVSFEREVVGFDETDFVVLGNGRLQSGTLVDNGDGSYLLSLDSLNEGLIELFIPSGSANALDDNTPTPPSDTLRIIYDITAPVVSIDAITTSDTSPALVGQVNDTASIVEIIVDSNSYLATVNSDSTWALALGTIMPALASGVYEVEVFATDIAGNVGTDATTEELVIDIEPPVVTVTLLATGIRSPMLLGTVDELTSALELEIDGNMYSGTNNDDGTWMLAAGIISPDLADGVYDVTVTATDVLGNVGVDMTSGELVVDNLPPSITVNPQTTSIRSPEINGLVDDVSAIIEITVDGTSYTATNNADGTWTLTAGTISPDLSDGVYDVVVAAEDEIGNTGNDETTDELVISTDIVALPASAITATSFEANWSTGIDPKEYRIDISEESDFSTFLTGYEDISVGTSTGLFVSPLDFKTRYYYRIRLVAQDDQVSANSNSIFAETTIDDETISDSIALVQIYDALDGSSWNPAVNWETARMRDWDRITLNSTQIRVETIDLSGVGATGDMPNLFIGNAIGGLSALVEMNASNNEITGLIDFSETSITSLNVSGNSLQFDDLEPLVGIISLDYSNQASIQFDQLQASPIEARFDTDYNLSATIGGSNNQYQWKRNDSNITTGADFVDNGSNLDILGIDYDNMGSFRATVTSPSLVPSLSIEVDEQSVLAIANMTVEVRNSEGDLLPEMLDAYLLETIRLAKGYDTLEIAENVGSTFVFPDVVLGNYLMAAESDPEKYVPTYFGEGDIVEWDKAETLFFRSNEAIQLQMTSVPPPPGDGEGTLDVIIEEDFGDDEGRIDARRRAARRKCGLRRKTGGGRTDEDADGYSLIAYGETDDNGEFQFGFLPEGRYRFFVEYPGIPLDDASFVEFEVGEAGISDTDFKLEAFASENGLEIKIEVVLGVIFKYFKNLQIYPNPSSDVLNISYRHLTTDAVRVELLDLTGAVLLQKDLLRGYDRALKLDVSPFEEGIYILRFYDTESREKNMISYRIIIQD